MHDGGIILIKAGQLITGRKELSKATGIPETTIERILKLLENEHQIGQQKTTKYRVITILNWEEHQNRTEERTTNGQQTDTYKNDKKEKNVAVADAPAPIEISLDRDENPKKESSAKYPNARKTFKWFPEQDEAWGIITTELRSGELLWKKGEGDVKKAITYCVRHLKDDRFPIPRLTPYLLITNWKRISDYAKRNS